MARSEAATLVKLPGFTAFANSVKVFRSGKYYMVESNGIPDHQMMVGIKAWQQQVPTVQPYTGTNAWPIPITPVISKTPISAKDHFLRGAIAVAINGVPIFNALTNHWRAISSEGNDIGLLGVAVAEPIRECDCWLFSCWIEPEFRGLGIMKLMIDELDVICLEENWTLQGLGVWPHNIRAIKSYEKYGFEKTGEPKASRSRPGQLFQPMLRHRPDSQ
jgi:GNAT superfamily N-acetyltransferase